MDPLENVSLSREFKKFKELMIKGQKFFDSSNCLIESTDQNLERNYYLWCSVVFQALGELLELSPGTPGLINFIKHQFRLRLRDDTNPKMAHALAGLNLEAEVWNILEVGRVEQAEFDLMYAHFGQCAHTISQNMPEQLEDTHQIYIARFEQRLNENREFEQDGENGLIIFKVKDRWPLLEFWLSTITVLNLEFKDCREFEKIFEDGDKFVMVISSLRSLQRLKDWPTNWCEKYGDSPTVAMLDLMSYHANEFCLQVLDKDPQQPQIQ